MQHRKWTALIGGVMALTVTACSNDASPSSTAGLSGPPPSSVDGTSPAGGNQVALILGTSGSPFYEAMACGAKAEAKKLGLNLKVSAAAQFAADQQIPVVNAVTASKPQVAVVVPTDAQALAAPLKSMVDAGIRLITADQTLADPAIVDTAIVTDNVAGGKMAAEEINTLIGGKGKVLVVTQPPGSTAQDQRVKGFEDELKTYSGITYLGPQYASNDPQKVAQIITATLAANSDLAAVFATNDQGAIGAINGLEQAGKTDQVKLVAYDAAKAEVDGLKNKTIQALIAQNPSKEGEVAMQTAKALIDGKQVEKNLVTELVVVRAGETEKADQYEYKGTC